VTKIFYRDNYTCQRCGVKGANLNAHHIVSFKKIISYYNITTLKGSENCDLLFDMNNGVTLCEGCHRWVHNEKNIGKKFLKGLEGGIYV
jgi:5-methylcytosine-specific restriction endonuclease McrA